jgi:hypothetical protein
MHTELKEALVGISKYQSLWLMGGWIDPIMKVMLPPMFFRDSQMVLSKMEAEDAARHIAESLLDEGYSVPSDIFLANGLFSFKSLNSIVLDQETRNLIQTRISYLENFV